MDGLLDILALILVLAWDGAFPLVLLFAIGCAAWDWWRKRVPAPPSSAEAATPPGELIAPAALAAINDQRRRDGLPLLYGNGSEETQGQQIMRLRLEQKRAIHYRQQQARVEVPHHSVNGAGDADEPVPF